jgi:TrmH family RNA methyltransferase
MTGTVDPWNPKAVRAGAGASFQTRIATAQTDDALAWLKAQRFTIFASDARGSPVEAAHRGDRVALVVGNEGAGIGQAVAEAADARIAVPMRGSAESLNVAVAAGILLYVITRENR